MSGVPHLKKSISWKIGIGFGQGLSDMPVIIPCSYLYEKIVLLGDAPPAEHSI